MNGSNHRFDCTTYSSRELMLILIVTLITTINIINTPTSASANVRNTTRNSSNIVSYEPKSDELSTVGTNNSNETLSTNKSDHQKLSTFNKKLIKNETQPSIQASSSATFDLVVKDESTQKYKRLREHETGKHSYNSNSPTTSSPKLENHHAQPSRLKDDDMITSDSRIYPKALSRADEDYDTPTEEETFGDGVYDEASSNLSEQKVVKELTKLISKGMAGATDQMKLDTLENWKRRQKERKVVKDSRAKLFEDLLTAAINSHPEKTKSKKRSKSSGNNQRSNASQQPSSESAPIIPEGYSLDPEVAGDAETVIKHLQGVASVIESTAPPGYEEGGSSLSDESPVTSDDSSTNGSTSPSDGTENSKTPKKGNKGEAGASSERPIVRQFKKIKNQISQRRKQLDQIKKMFNIDLSINPKDGSLVGKSASIKKGTDASGISQEWGDFTIIDDSTSPPNPTTKSKKRSSKSSSKSSKMTELLLYLKENPEILASVMSELTVNADSRSSSSSSPLTGPQLSSGADDGGYDHLAQDLLGRRVNSINGLQTKHNDLERILWDRARKATRQIEQTNLELADLPSSSVIVPPEMKQSRYDSLQDLYKSSYNQPPLSSLLNGHKSAEARLLESLRDRQLLNLMKLDMVLAERQQQASNRSHTFTVPNAPLPSTLSAGDRSESKPYYQVNYQKNTNQTQDNLNRSMAQRNNNLHNSTSLDEEVVHHYMVMNGHAHPADALSSHRFTNSRQSSDWRTPIQHNQPSHKSHHDLGSNYQHQYPSEQSMAFRSAYQQKFQPLSRFKEWRDVGQPETSQSQRNDAINNVQINSYDLTTGGSSAEVDRHGSPRDMHSFHKTHQLRPMASHNESFSSTTTDTGVHQVRDYSDSLVIKPDHHMISAYQQTDEELMNPNSSIFMTRSSITQKDIATSGLSADNEKDSDYHSTRGRISREDVEEKLDDDPINNPENSPRERHHRPASPVNYFSAYKKQTQPPADYTESFSQGNYKKLRPHSEQPGLEYDGMGAIWAK